MRVVIICLLLILECVPSWAQYQPSWSSLDSRPVPAWYQDAKFGIFVHWGLYSVPSWATKSNADGFGSGYSEWYWQRLSDPKLKIHKEFVEFHKKNFGPEFNYQDFAGHFKAELFNPDDWARIFEQSGAKYIVLTSKHHEGFTLWPSSESWNWNSVDVGPHRDLAGDLIAAVKAKGLRMGYYYSLYEWFNPTYKTDPAKYVDQKMLPQLKDLVTRYKPDVIWADGEWEQSSKVWRSEEFLSWLYNDSPVKQEVVVNDRWGNDTKGKHGGFYTTEYGQGATSDARAWEECRGIGESFGYNRNENLEDYVSSNQLIKMLVSIVAKGGNFLLNIGPTADGRIPVIMQQRLKDAGDWLKVNGEAIYGTTTWKGAPKEVKGDTIFYTAKGKDLYVISTRWMDKITVAGVAKPRSVTLLGFAGKIQNTYSKNKLTLSMPVVTPETLPCQYAWIYKLEGVLSY